MGGIGTGALREVCRSIHDYSGLAARASNVAGDKLFQSDRLEIQLTTNMPAAIDQDILLKWRLIIHDGRQRGFTYSHPDVLIAATAAQHGMTVVTRNVREFVDAGVAVLDPWTGKLIKAR
jgi:predicted nucleic acid-binding protein